MTKRRPAGPAAAAILLCAAVGAAQEAPPAEPEIGVKIQSIPSRGKPLRLLIDVQAPDDTPMKVTLVRLFEEYSPNGQIMKREDPVDSRVKAVEGKKIRYEHKGKGQGLYRLLVQNQMTRKRWAPLDVPAWEEDLIREARRRISDVDALAQEALGLLDRLIAASANKAAWNASAAGLGKEIDRLLQKMDTKTEAKLYFPAAIEDLFMNVQNLQSSSPLLKFAEDGRLVGAEDYYGKKLDTAGQEFNFNSVRAYVANAPTTAGRELGIWICKEIRRDGKRTSPIDDCLKEHEKHPGIAAFLKRLEEAQPADVDQLEKDLRGERRREGEGQQPQNTQPGQPGTPGQPKPPVPPKK